MKVDNKLISKIEHLARLELSVEERNKIQGDLNNILEMVSKLDELDTSGVEPLVYMTDQANIFRKDEVRNQVDRKEALKNAPDATDTFFKVPKVISY